MKLNQKMKTSMSLAAAVGTLALATSANAAIISTADAVGTGLGTGFTITTNIAPLGTVVHDEPNPIWDGVLNNGVWAYGSATETLHYRHATTVADPSRIYITWDQDYQIDKIGLVHAETGLPYRVQDYELQSLNPGGDPTADGDWTNIGGVTANPLIYAEYTIDTVTTRGIRLYITKATATGGDDLARFEEFLVQGTAVPEPTTTALLGLGGLALILRRRK